MDVPFRRSWEGKEWEAFSLRLVQQRHGVTNVQVVPDAVRGDAGIECFTADGCCYQSYAPEEVADVAKAASAMKRKASRDIQKLKKNEAIISALMAGKKIRRWFLLCPFLDNKDVVSHVAGEGGHLVQAGLELLHEDFRAFVHCPVDFVSEIFALRQASAGAPLKLVDPSPEEIAGYSNSLDQTLDDKLSRGFPLDTQQRRLERKKRLVGASIRSQNTLNELKENMPELWERCARAISLEGERLEMFGPSPGAPVEQIEKERDRLLSVLKESLPTLEGASVASIAQGQIGTWLIECPLDFEGG